MEGKGCHAEARRAQAGWKTAAWVQSYGWQAILVMFYTYILESLSSLALVTLGTRVT